MEDLISIFPVTCRRVPGEALADPASVGFNPRSVDFSRMPVVTWRDGWLLGVLKSLSTFLLWVKGDIARLAAVPALGMSSEKVGLRASFQGPGGAGGTGT